MNKIFKTLKVIVMCVAFFLVITNYENRNKYNNCRDGLLEILDILTI